MIFKILASGLSSGLIGYAAGIATGDTIVRTLVSLGVCVAVYSILEAIGK